MTDHDLDLAFTKIQRRASSVGGTENEPATVETFGGDDSTAVVVPKKLRKAKAAETIAGEKKFSAVAAALKVLGESTEPMNTKEMVEAMASKGLWSSPRG